MITGRGSERRRAIRSVEGASLDRHSAGARSVSSWRTRAQLDTRGANEGRVLACDGDGSGRGIRCHAAVRLRAGSCRSRGRSTVAAVGLVLVRGQRDEQHRHRCRRAPAGPQHPRDVPAPPGCKPRRCGRRRAILRISSREQARRCRGRVRGSGASHMRGDLSSARHARAAPVGPRRGPPDSGSDPRRSARSTPPPRARGRRALAAPGRPG
jgi:hypothetical protein